MTSRGLKSEWRLAVEIRRQSAFLWWRCLDARAGACRPSPGLNHDRCNGNEGFEAFVCFAAMHGDPSVFLKRQQALLKNLFPECPLPIGGVEIIRQLGRADCN
jgi:hypothetical protein